MMDSQAELCETYQLKWSSHNTYIHSCIASALHSSNSFTDVALITTDGHQIMAHRFILSYSSQFLAQILKMQPKKTLLPPLDEDSSEAVLEEATKTTFTFSVDRIVNVTSALPLMIVMPPEINHKSLKILVKYMYSGEAKVTKDILQSVLKGGVILQIKGLYRGKEECEENVKITQQAANVQLTPSKTPTPPLSIPSTIPVTINNSLPISIANIASTTKSNVLVNPLKTIPNVAAAPSKTTAIPIASSKSITNNNPPPNKSQCRPIEPLPSTSGIPKEKLIQTTNSPQTFLVLQKPKDVQPFNPRVLNFTITHTFDQNGQLNKEESPIQRKAVILNKPVETQSEEITVKDEPRENNLQYLMIKDEPMEWNEEIDVISPKEVFEGITVKAEIDENNPESNNSDEILKEDVFSPLTCELCTATFTIPGDWVRHVQSHTDMLPAKRRRRDSAGDSYENDSFPELMCDLCQQPFSTPADWVKHIQSAHTEFELHMSNRQNPSGKAPICAKTNSSDESEGSKQCIDCNKTFPSHASMLIHLRKHTGERPYGCEYCNKSFNVKSNLLRHLRTLHNKMINAKDLDKEEENSN